MTLEEAAKFIAEFFKDEPEKITLWWHTENMNIGGVTPAFLYFRRPEKCLKWIKNMKDGNLP